MPPSNSRLHRLAGHLATLSAAPVAGCEADGAAAAGSSSPGTVVVGEGPLRALCRAILAAAGSEAGEQVMAK